MREMLVVVEDASLSPQEQQKTGEVRLIVGTNKWTITVQPDGKLKVNPVGLLAPTIQIQPGGGVNSIVLGGSS